MRVGQQGLRTPQSSLSEPLSRFRVGITPPILSDGPSGWGSGARFGKFGEKVEGKDQCLSQSAYFLPGCLYNTQAHGPAAMPQGSVLLLLRFINLGLEAQMWESFERPPGSHMTLCEIDDL